MLLGGDEMGRTQGGNDNAYCQDNELSWFDWAAVDRDLLEFTRTLIGLRRSHPALTPQWFRQGPGDNVREWVTVQRSDDKPFGDADWDNPDARSIAFVFGHADGDAFALLLNAAENVVEFTVPEAPHAEWSLALSSDPGQQVTAPVATLLVADASFTLLQSKRD